MAVRRAAAALFLVLAGCAADSGARPSPIVSTVTIGDPDPTAAPYDLSDVAADSGAGTPRIWMFERNGAELALFGTMHVAPQGLRWLSPKARRAFESADLVLTEVGMTSASRFNPSVEELQALSPLLVRHDARDTRDRVAMPGTPERAELDTALEMLGLRAEQVAQGQPWTTCLDMFNGARPGAQVRLSRDARAKREAAIAAMGPLDSGSPDARIEVARLSRGLSHQPLETFATRARVYSTMRDDEALACIRAIATRTVEGADFDALPERFHTAVERWRSGDVETARRAEEDRARMISPALAARLLQAREADWLVQIDALCAAPGRRCAVAVGFAHLGGADGMLKQLARRGWRPAGEAQS